MDADLPVGRQVNTDKNFWFIRKKVENRKIATESQRHRDKLKLRKKL